MENLAPGEYRMLVKIPDVHLNPGNYNIGIGISTSGRSADHVNDAAQIEVLPSPESIRRELHKVWSPLTPRTDFRLIRHET